MRQVRLAGVFVLHAEVEQVFHQVELVVGQGDGHEARHVPTDEAKHLGPRRPVFFHGGDLDQGAAAGNAFVEQGADQFQLRRVLGGPVALDQIDNLFRRVGVDAPFELIEDFAGTPPHLGVVALGRRFEGLLGRFAGFPEALGGFLAFVKILVAQLLRPALDLLRSRRVWCRGQP